MSSNNYTFSLTLSAKSPYQINIRDKLLNFRGIGLSTKKHNLQQNKVAAYRGTRVRSQFVIQVNTYALDVIGKGTFPLNGRQHLRLLPPGPPPNFCRPPPPPPPERRRIPEDTPASLRRREGILRGWAELRRRAAATARSEPGVVAHGLSGGLRVFLEWRLRRFFVVVGGDEPAQIRGWVGPPPDRRAGLVWIVFFRSFLGGLRWFLQQRTVLFWTLYGEFLLESVLVLSGVDADMKGNFAELMIKF